VAARASAEGTQASRRLELWDATPTPEGPEATQEAVEPSVTVSGELEAIRDGEQ
jgi:hypothetical protein